MIIFEGANGMGKTTMAHALCDLIDGEYVHRGPPESSALTEYVAPLAWYDTGCGKNIILDRWHFGEMVYGPSRRGKCLIDEQMYIDINEFLARRGAVVVYCHGSSVYAATRVELRDNTIVNHLQLARDMHDFERVLRDYPTVLRSQFENPLPLEYIRAIAYAAEVACPV